MRWSLLFLIVVTILATIGCQPSPYYSNDLIIDDGSWDQADELVGTFEIVDTVSRYNLYLDLDHSTDYRYENIYLQIETQFPHKDPVTQVLPIDIANKKGQWYGKCGSKSCKLRVVLRDKTKFEALGNYQIKISQHSREDQLTGVNAVELLVMESE
jgi:gliding motility-associated lipoprotein GldH